jgi:hypothetical protein
MRGNERYVLGSGVDVGGRCIIPVIRIFSITSHQLAFVTVDPAGILIREGEEKFRIALEDHLSWEEIGEVIPEVDRYQDLELKNDDEGSGDKDLPDREEQSGSQRHDYIVR